MTKLRRSLLSLAAVLGLALLFLPSMVQGQAVLVTVQGQVTDDSGGALPGVSCAVRNQDTGTERTTQTDTSGRYKAAGLQPGDYSVTCSLEGFQSLQQDDIGVLVGQIIDVNFTMTTSEVSEVITVTSEAPLVEVSRTSAASYVSEREIESLPILGRDFKEFAFLTPTVQDDPSRGFITMSGQRGIYSGLNIDGTSAKSAFFGYGRGGEATENDGIVVAQDSVKEFQVITSSFAPEYGANAGGYINVVTKSGTNDLRGSAFYYFRDESLADDLERSPLDKSRGQTDDIEISDFSVDNIGVTFGGPIAKDKTHFFALVDQVTRKDPIVRSLDPGTFDLIMEKVAIDPRFLPLLDGYARNDDGSATGLFSRDVDNLILFGKLDHQFTDSQSASFRVNFTDYERLSSFKDEESEKLTDTLSFVGSLVSVIGSTGINEFRLQQATDNLDRLSLRVGEPIEAQIRFRFGGFDSVGKFDFLPIFVEESKLQVQDTFSYLMGDHDLKFGVDYQRDDLSQLFAGSKDGRYDFTSAENFLDNVASNVRIYFGNVQNPNYDEVQSLLGVYAQDTYKRANLTLAFGVRYGATYNPDDLPHIFPEGRDIPDDTDNIAPRVGFTYALGESGRDVIRGGVGLFFGRTPSLLFASQVQQDGLFPNFGRINVGPGDIGFVPLGESIDNENPPLDAPNSPAWVDPSFEDAETWRVNFGYERQLATSWSGNVDLVYAEGSNLQSNVELNRTLDRYDEFGRPVYSSTRPNPEFNEWFTRQSIGESEYTAVTFQLKRRFSGRYQLQGHYTWSEDKDTDSNERSATGVTVSDPTDIRYDWGLSDRDVENRVVLSGLVTLPWDINLSGIFEYRDGRPWTPHDGDQDFAYCGFGRLGFNCVEPRGIIGGERVTRNSFSNESVSRLDLRIGKTFSFGDVDLDLFAEVFNLLDQNSFEIINDFTGFDQTTPGEDEFGLADRSITRQRQWQLGVRLSFR